MSKQVTDQDAGFEFEFNGEKLSREELERRLKFDSANTQRAQEIAEERRQVQADRQRVAEQEARLAQERTQLYSTLDTLVNKVGSESEPEAPKRQLPSYLDALKGIDLVSDSEAASKLAQNIERTSVEREAAIRAELREENQRNLAALEAKFGKTLEGKVAEVQQQAEVKLTRHTAAEQAETRNERVFRETLDSKLADLNLTADEITAIKQKALTTYSDTGGQWDANAGVWLTSDRGILEAARSIDSVFDKMRAADRVGARRDGLQARVRGEDASRSTPNRSRPAFGGEPNQTPVAEWDLLRTRLDRGYISPGDAMEVLKNLPGGVEGYKAWKQSQDQLLRSG